MGLIILLAILGFCFVFITNLCVLAGVRMYLGIVSRGGLLAGLFLVRGHGCLMLVRSLLILLLSITLCLCLVCILDDDYQYSCSVSMIYLFV